MFNFGKHVWSLWESYEKLIKDIKEDMNKWEKTVFLDWKI